MSLLGRFFRFLLGEKSRNKRREAMLKADFPPGVYRGSPVSPEAWQIYRDGTYKLYQGDLDGAIAVFTEYAGMQPDDILVYFRRAEAYVKKSEVELAIADLTEVIRLHPINLSAYLERAKLYFSEKSQIDIDAAIADYSAAIQQYSWGPKLYWQRAMAYTHKNDFDNAIKDIEACIERCSKTSHYPGLAMTAPRFLIELQRRTPAPWFELWKQLQQEVAPIESLIDQLADDDDKLRDEAVEKLGKIGAPALPLLLEELKRNDRNEELSDYESGYPGKAMVAIGDPAFEALAEVLFTNKGGLARAAAKHLHWFGEDRAEPYLRKALTHPNVNSNTRYYVEQGLGIIAMRREERRKQQGNS